LNILSSRYRITDLNVAERYLKASMWTRFIAGDAQASNFILSNSVRIDLSMYVCLSGRSIRAAKLPTAAD